MKVSVSRSAYTLAFLGVACLAIATLRGPHGLHALSERRAQIHDMEQRNAALAQRVERKREHIRRIIRDPEPEIRERLKLVRPGEKVYILGDSAK